MKLKITLLLLIGLSNIYGQGNFLSKNQMLRDLAFLEEQIIAIHPALDMEEEIKKVENELFRIRKNLPAQLNINDFFVRLSPVFDHIDCSHTLIYPRKNERFGTKTFFPLNLVEIDNEVLLADSYDDTTTKIERGSRIKAINKTPIDSIIADLFHFHGGSDEPDNKVKRAYAIRKLQSRYRTFYGEVDSFEVTIQDINSMAIRTVKLKAKKRKVKRKILDLTIDQDAGIGILKINSFAGYGFWHLRYGMKLKKIFKQLQKQEVQKLIIDIRDNSGGAYLNSKRLLKYLLPQAFQICDFISIKKSGLKKLGLNRLRFIFYKKTEKADQILFDRFSKQIKPFRKRGFKGELIVLLNSNSLSASTLFGALIKSNERGTLVGTASGGGYHKTFGGTFKFIKLKASGIIVRIPILKLQFNVKEDLQEKGTNLKPHISSSLNIETFKSTTDLQLKKCFEILTK